MGSFSSGLYLSLKLKKTGWWLAVLVFLLGSFLRVFTLGKKSLWFDEVLSLQMSAKNFDQIWQELTRVTNSPPLYLWLLHFFIKIQVSEFWARIPSALFGILTLLLVYRFGKELFSQHAAFFTLFLVAISPLHIYYSQEARMYSLWTFLLTLSFYCLYRLCKGEGGLFLRAGYFLSLLLSIYTHYFSIFYLFTHGAVAAACWWKSSEKKSPQWWIFPIAWVGTLLCAIPLIPLSRQGFSYGNGLPLHDWTLKIVFEEFIRSWMVFITLGGGGGYYLGYHFPLAFLLFVLFYIGLYATLRRDKPLFLFFLAWIVIPLYTGIFFLEGRTAYHERFFLPVTIPYLLLAGAGLYATATRLARAVRGLRHWKNPPLPKIKLPGIRMMAVVLPVLLLLGLFYNPLHEYYRFEKQDGRSAAKYVAAHALPGDSVVFGGFGEAAMAYYFQDIRLPIVNPKTVREIETLAQSSRRLWVVYGWESSGVWDAADLYQWSIKNGTPQQTIPGAFPIHIFLFDPGINKKQ